MKYINYLLVILVLIFLIFIVKNRENFTQLENIASKAKLNKTDILDSARNVSVGSEAPILDKTFDDELLQDFIIDHDFYNDEGASNNYETQDEFIKMTTTNDVKKSNLDSNIPYLEEASIFNIEQENRNLREKINGQRYEQDKTLKGLKNELFKLLHLNESLDSLEYKNKNVILDSYNKEIEYHKNNPSDKSNLEIAKIYNNIATVYDALGNNSEAFFNIEKALHHMYKLSNNNNNFYTGLSFHNKGLIEFKLDKTEASIKSLKKAKEIFNNSKKFQPELADDSDSKLNQINNDIKRSNCKLNDSVDCDYL